MFYNFLNSGLSRYLEEFSSLNEFPPNLASRRTVIIFGNFSPVVSFRFLVNRNAEYDERRQLNFNQNCWDYIAQGSQRQAVGV